MECDNSLINEINDKYQSNKSLTREELMILHTLYLVYIEITETKNLSSFEKIPKFCNMIHRSE